MRSTFRSFERLRRREDFLRAQRSGFKRVGRHLVAWGYPRNESPWRAVRLGVLVRRKDGRAVQRNLFKRRMRDIYRLNKAAVERGWDIVVAMKRVKLVDDGATARSYTELQSDFLDIVCRFKRNTLREVR